MAKNRALFYDLRGKACYTRARANILRSVTVAMSYRLIQKILREYEALLHLSPGSAWDEVEQRAALWLSEHDLDEIKLRQEVLRAISSDPQLHREAEEAFRRFHKEGLSLEADDEAILHEAYSLWQKLPQNLVDDHWDLVKEAAIRFQGDVQSGAEGDFDELMAIGQEALVEAAVKIGDRPRDDFRKFARQMLRDQIRHFQSTRHPLPFKTRKKLEKLRDCREELAITGRSEQEVELLTEAMGIHKEDMPALLELETVWGDGHNFISVGDQLEELNVPDLSPSALDLLIDQQESMRMSEAMTQLSAMERHVVHAVYFKEMSLRQTAQALEVSLSVVKKHLKAALGRLRRQLGDEEFLKG